MINLGNGTIESSFNGVITKNTSSLSVVTRNGLTLGSHRNRTGLNTLDGPYQEFIYFTSSQTLNRPEIELNINEAYNIFATSSAAISSPPIVTGKLNK